MTIIGPILMAAIMIVPVFIAKMSDETKTIAVVDETGVVHNRLPVTKNLKYEYLMNDITSAKQLFRNSNYYYALLYIPKEIVNNHASFKKPINPILYSESQASLNIKMFLEGAIKKEFESIKLEASGVDPEVLKSIEMRVNMTTVQLKDNGKKEEEGNIEVSTILAIFSMLHDDILA